MKVYKHDKIIDLRKRILIDDLEEFYNLYNKNNRSYPLITYDIVSSPDFSAPFYNRSLVDFSNERISRLTENIEINDFSIDINGFLYKQPRE